MLSTCFWGVLQSFKISKLLRITILTFLFVSNSLLNTGFASAMNITLDHKHKRPTAGIWIWKVQVNSPVPLRSQSTRSEGQTHDQIRCVWCNKTIKQFYMILDFLLTLQKPRLSYKRSLGMILDSICGIFETKVLLLMTTGQEVVI